MRRRRFRNVLTLLDEETQMLFVIPRSEWRELSNNGREYYRQKAQLQIAGRARLLRELRFERRPA